MSESVWPFTCAHCGRGGFKAVRDINRAEKRGARLFCNRTCTGLARRVDRTEAEKKTLKAAYDAEYRTREVERRRQLKADYHKRTSDPAKAAKQRKKTMPRHVEYCRRPEYRKRKSEYDRNHRAQKFFGDFAEAALLLNDIEREVGTRITRTEVYRQNGTLNKWIQRRRDYEQTVGR